MCISFNNLLKLTKFVVIFEEDELHKILIYFVSSKSLSSLIEMRAGTHSRDILDPLLTTGPNVRELEPRKTVTRRTENTSNIMSFPVLDHSLRYIGN